jgi:aminoglycoside phosphotransferase (APT) family kinase protein
MRRLLAEVGLRPVATYATRPDSRCPLVYIPLEARHALLWYLRTLQGTPDARSWLLNQTLTTLGTINPGGLRVLVPEIAVVARKPSSEPADQATGVSILSDPALRRTLGTDDLHALLVSGQRTIMFLFGRESTTPLAVIKIPKFANQNQATENGHHALSTVRHLDSTIASSVPEPLLLLSWHDSSVAVETLITGNSLSRIFDTWLAPLSAKIAGLRDAARWLRNFHRRTLVSRVPWDAGESCRWLTTPVEAYCRIFGATEHERALFARAHDYAAAIRPIHLPIVGQHRDFRPVNVLRGESGQIAVVDWEGYRTGPAFCDLFHFLMTWHYSARRLLGVRSLERLLFEPGTDAVADAVHEVVDAYLRGLELHAAAIPLLVLYTVVELAIRRSEQQARYGDTDFRRDNENVEFVRALASHREELFGEPRAGSLLSGVSR